MQKKAEKNKKTNIRHYPKGVSRQKGYILIVSEKIMNILSYLSKNKLYGAAPLPYLIILRKSHYERNDIIIQHEKIHQQQMKKLFFIGFYLLYGRELFYYRRIKKLSHEEAYLKTSAEQEAYRNQHKKDYKSSYVRIKKHYKEKKKIHFDLKGNPVISH